MELDDVRQEVIELVAKIHPLMQTGVWNPDAYRSHYLTPFRARDLNVLQKYERQHQTIFCRQCLTKDEKKGLLLVHQLWIEETDNGLENKPGEWVSLQCQNPDCDFDLVTPRPQPAKSAAEEHAEKLQELMEKYRYNQYQQLANTPQWIIGNSTTTTWPDGSLTGSTSPSITIQGTGQNALAAAGQALSSASTSTVTGTPAKPPSKPTLYEKLINKYIR